MNLNRTLLLLALLVVVTGASAYMPTTSSPGSGPAAHDPDKVYFIIETDQADPNRPEVYLPTVRRVGVTINAYQADGRPAVDKDPKTGNTRAPIILESRQTPLPYKIELEPGVVGVEIAVHFFGKQGERVKCHVEVDGVMVPGSENVREIIRQADLAVVNCFWH